MFEERPSPAKISAAAAAKLPRWALLALLAAFILPGLLGREPWTLKDAAAFGVMWTMAQGGAADWLLPNIAGSPAADAGPLAGWVGALLIRVAGESLGAPAAARLSVVLWFALAVAALWYATWRLARRAEAQPVAFAFGGEAQPRDYGRALADVAVLLLVATFGLLVRLHEALPDTAMFALAATAFFGVVWGLDRPWAGALLTGAAAGGVALASSLQAAAWILVAAAAIAAATPGARLRRSLLPLPVAALVFGAWPLAASLWGGAGSEAWFAAWWQNSRSDFGLLDSEGYVWLARNLAWYTWPLWPFAGWAIYSWRHALRLPHMAVALVWLAAALAAMPLSSSLGDSQMLLMVPALVVLGAFGASSLRRGAENVIDWFSIALFTLAGLALWFYFIAWQTGWPPKMARSLLRFAPGAGAEIQPLHFATALAATVAWIGFVAWRIRRQPVVLWRGPWLAAAGLTMSWIVAVGLFRDAIDTNRDYRLVARSVAAAMANAGGGPDDCVRAWRVPPGAQALIAYYGGLRFVADRAPEHCRFLLHRDLQKSQLDNELPPGVWELKASLPSRSRSDEVLHLLATQR